MARRGKPIPETPFEIQFDPAEPVLSDALDWNGARLAVPGALPGERLRVRAQRWRRGRPRRLECTVEAIHDAHAARVAPRCAHVDRCGGCSLQHLALPAQLRLKTDRLQRLLVEAGIAPEFWEQPVPSPALGYRHKARLGVRHVPQKGGVLVGFRERGSARVADVTACHILHPSIGRRLPALRALIASLSVPDAVPQIEIAAGEGRTALVLRHVAPLDAADRQRIVDFGVRHDLEMLTQAGGPESVVNASGAPSTCTLGYRLDGGALQLRFEPLQFSQINPAVNERMVARAMRWLRPGPGDRVLDLFCGLGNFTLPLARRADAVLGLEGDAGLVRQGVANAVANGIDNARFAVADLYGNDVVLPPGYRLALLDPPRSGAGTALPALLENRPVRILYVACGPEAFAREAAALVAAGYRFRRAALLDMFPHTRHYETMGLFERDGGLDGPAV